MVLTLLWIVGLTNAYNFMDGIDGIAGCQAAIAGMGWCALGGWSGLPLVTVLGLLLAASSLGFLIHNWPPAKIFMGDVGSTFLGYSLAVLPILAAQSDPRLAVAGVLLVWPSVFDASFTFLRRLRRGENVFAAHRSHLYQRLVITGLSHRWVSSLYGALALIGLALACAWTLRLPGGAPAVALILPLLCLSLWLFVVQRERRQVSGPDPALRKLHEKQYFDQAYEHGIRKPAAKFYSIVSSSKGLYRDRVLELGRGKRVLEYGCGTGSYAFELGRLGATVTGIDISEKAVEIATAMAREQGLNNVHFAVMDAEQTNFPAHSFDLVCGSGILHHLEVAAAMREITRLLKPDGHAVFFEALGHNPLINCYRRLTPGLRSPDERPLKLGDLEVASGYFQRPELRFFHLFALTAIPIRNSRVFARALRALDRLDTWCFTKMPFLRRHAWVVVLQLQGPKPCSNGRGRSL
jgi:SAM-dependent methyltransferase